MVRLALIDSGLGNGPDITEARSFAADGTIGPVCPPRVGHGAALAEVVRHQCPAVALLDAQVFTDSPTTSAAAVAAAIVWATGAGADIINLSLGLRHDRPALAAACANARAAGVLIVASSPARGGPVFPAAYAGVIRVCGDARCGPGEFSALDTPQADIGACVFTPDAHHGDRARSGASYATAYVSGRLAALQTAAAPDSLAALRAECRWQGPERRTQ